MLVLLGCHSRQHSAVVPPSGMKTGVSVWSLDWALSEVKERPDDLAVASFTLGHFTDTFHSVSVDSFAHAQPLAKQALAPGMHADIHKPSNTQKASAR